MAAVKVSHRFADGEETTVTVSVATSYPDALSEAKACAVDALGRAVAIVLALEEAGDEESD